jgi:hypothetical protein
MLDHADKGSTVMLVLPFWTRYTIEKFIFASISYPSILHSTALLEEVSVFLDKGRQAASFLLRVIYFNKVV